jgi:TnpA family transposase
MSALYHPPSHGRLKLFTAQEYDDFYGLPRFDDEMRARYFSLSLADKHLLNSFKTYEHKLFFVLCLGYFRAKRCLIDFKLKAVASDWAYIVNLYFPDKKVYKKLPDLKQRTRIQNKILSHEEYTRWTQKSEHSFKGKLDDLVQRHPKPRALIKAFMDQLSRNKFALPSYSTLQRLISKTMTQEKNRLFSLGHNSISRKEQKFIQSLLTTEASLSPLESIRIDVKDFRLKELRKEIKKQEYLEPLFHIALNILRKSNLPKKTIEHYGSLVNFYSIYKLRRMPQPQAVWYLLCYSFTRYQKVNDNLVQFFKHYVSHFHELCRKYSQEKLEDLQKEMDKWLIQAGYILQLFISDSSAPFVDKQVAFKFLPKDHIRSVSQYLLGKTRDEFQFYWEHVDFLKHKITLHLRSLFLAIDFTTIKQADLNHLFPVMKEFLQGALKNEASLKALVPRRTKPYLQELDGSLKKDRFEFFFYKKIARHIETQRLTLSHSQRYKSLKEEVILESIWEKEKSSILEKLGYPKLVAPIEQTLESFKNILNPLLDHVNKRIEQRENKHVKIKYGEEINWSLSYERKKEQVDNPFFMQFPQVDIIDILYFADYHCGFLNLFTPIQSYSQKDELNRGLLLAAIVANAIRLGTYKMADVAFLNLNELLNIERTYIRLETLGPAIDKINTFTAQLPIFPTCDIYGKLHSSLDGSKIGTRLETLKARHSPKYYGLEKGVSSYNHIANNLPLNARIISPNDHESHFTFPLVYNNTSDVNPSRHSGDSHSANQTSFTLFDMIDHQFMPHFPSINKKPISCFGPIHAYKNAIIKPSHQIRVPLIIDEWPDVQHIIASILQNETDQSRIIAKLSSHKYYSKTKEALWEYESILRSIYILNYIDDLTLRQSVRMALNRGESYHQIYKAISYINGGRFRGNSEREIETWGDCTRLLASAIIYYNAYTLSLLLEQAKNKEERDFISQLSPIAWSHINFLGKYDFKRKPSPIDPAKWVKQIEINPSKYKA